MLERGQISFVVLWVLNPIMILFFQNCSWAPPVQSQGPTTPVVSSASAVASVGDERTPAVASYDRVAVCRPGSQDQLCFE